MRVPKLLRPLRTLFVSLFALRFCTHLRWCCVTRNGAASRHKAQVKRIFIDASDGSS